MVTSEILLLEHQTMATLTVEEFYYSTTQNQESDKTNNILSVVVTDNIEALPGYISSKPHLLNNAFLYSKTILHSSSLIHQEGHISLSLTQKGITISL